MVPFKKTNNKRKIKKNNIKNNIFIIINLTNNINRNNINIQNNIILFSKIFLSIFFNSLNYLLIWEEIYSNRYNYI